MISLQGGTVPLYGQSDVKEDDRRPTGAETSFFLQCGV